MDKIKNFVTGLWVKGADDGAPLHNAVNGDLIGFASSKGLDFQEILNYGRNTGNRLLRKMTFPERGRMLRALALHLTEKKEKFYSISYKTGATRTDSWIDIDGGIGNLFSYASLRRKLPNQSFLPDGEVHQLGKEGNFLGQHILVPREGVAVHINAYNFPVWGMLEKIAVNLLAGIPAVVKPATVTCFLTEAVVQEIHASGILPDGALQLICGSAGDLLDHVNGQDVVTFTGSASTGKTLRNNANIIRENVPFTMEADSLNCITLGTDVYPGTSEWDLFIKEIRKEMTAKAGQKCTAIRRIFVPADRMEAVWKDLTSVLQKTSIGNPENEKVRMGALASKAQREEVRNQVRKLLTSSQIIYGSLQDVELIDADAEKGAFMGPVLLHNDDPFISEEPHNIEAFGPVSTIMPYRNMDEAVELAKKGKGSLCCSIVTASREVAKKFVLGAATHHGRILVLNNDCAKENTGHGSPLPMLVHGGPGRAGGGEEMGGIRGVKHYMQRLAVQASPDMMTAITSTYYPGARQPECAQHPFQKYFEDLKIGETLVTGKRTVTEADIVNFANLSWDHFYAHVDHTSLAGTMFEKPVAHGYFILSAAAGLFVDGKKGPVLLNYGIEECRFIKPVYAGTTIGVKLTVKEKIPQELKDENDIPKGIIKWYVDVYDNSGESVAIATILTMVRLRMKKI